MQIKKDNTMKNKDTTVEDVHQIIRDVAGIDAPKKKKTKKRRKLIETDIDIFADQEEEQSQYGE